MSRRATGADPVETYIASQPEDARDTLRRVRNVILAALPDAEESLSYKIPSYSLHGARVLYFAGWKRHYSLYPAGERLRTAFKDELARYDIDKGTIRFPLSEPIPAQLIERIARFRANEITEAKEASAMDAGAKSTAARDRKKASRTS